MSRALFKVLRETLKVESLHVRRSPSHFRLLLSSAICRSVSAVIRTMSSAPTISAPECLFHPLDFPHKTLMGPGPSNAPPRVLGASALPLLGHLHPEFTQIMDQVKQGIQYAFQTQNEWTFAISGTGHAAMEAVVANLLEIGDVALVCQNGIWGQRFADMVDRNGSVAKKLLRPMGEVFTLQEVEEGLKTYQPVLMFVTHGESSAGTAQPLEECGGWLVRCFGGFLWGFFSETFFLLMTSEKESDSDDVKKFHTCVRLLSRAYCLLPCPVVS